MEILEKLEVVGDYKEIMLSGHKRMFVGMNRGSYISVFKQKSRNNTRIERGPGHSV